MGESGVDGGLPELPLGVSPAIVSEKEREKGEDGVWPGAAVQ